MTRDSDRGHAEESSVSKWPEPLALLKERKRETERDKGSILVYRD